MGDTDELEEYIRHNPMPNVRFIAIRPNWWANALNWLNRHNTLVYTFYLAYRVWQRLAYREARRLVESERFDLIHYVGPIGYREPGYLWRIELPYMWGSIGGAPNINPRLIEALPTSGRIKLQTRAMLNNLQLRHNKRLRRALRRCDLLLTATTENQQIFRERFGAESIYLPENGIEDCYPLNRAKFQNIERVELIFIGHIDSRKSLITTLKSLTKVTHKESVRLNVVGGGRLIKPLQTYCEEHKISHMVVWHGKVSRREVIELIDTAHLHIITSAMEANTTVIFEAMSRGVPTLSLDQCGMHDTICDMCGFLLPIHSLEQITSDIATIIDDVVEHPHTLELKAEGVLRCREKYLWHHRTKRINHCYELAMRHYQQRVAVERLVSGFLSDIWHADGEHGVV